VLVKTTVQQAAAALSKMINGQATFDLFEKTVIPGKNAFVVVRAKGMAWCNIFQVAPANQWLNDSDNMEPFATKLAKASGTFVLAIQYSDTSDAASIFRAGPDGKSTSDASWDNVMVEEMVGTMGDKAPAWAKQRLADADEDDLTSTERLKQLAEREKFVVAAFGFFGGLGQKLELELPGYDPAQFDGIAFVTD
jgi:hypothetical protein